MFLLILNIAFQVIKSQECADFKFAMKCMDNCYLDQQTCMIDCNKETCRLSCYNGLTECINQCPCQVDCPRGCDGCNHSVCEQRD